MTENSSVLASSPLGCSEIVSDSSTSVLEVRRTSELVVSSNSEELDARVSLDGSEETSDSDSEMATVVSSVEDATAPPSVSCEASDEICSEGEEVVSSDNEVAESRREVSELDAELAAVSSSLNEEVDRLSERKVDASLRDEEPSGVSSLRVLSTTFDRVNVSNVVSWIEVTMTDVISELLISEVLNPSEDANSDDAPRDVVSSSADEL